MVRGFGGLVLAVCAAVVVGCGGSMVATALTGTPLEQARGRVKVLTEAFRIYLGDTDDGTPLAANWMDAMLPYVKDEANYLAPGVGDASAGVYGFAYNEAVAGRWLPEFPDRSVVPLFFDSTVTARHAVSNIGTLPVPGRYDGVNVISYMDGFQEGFDVIEVSRGRLRKLATAALIYSGDHDDHLPGSGWFDDLQPYSKESRIFRSPVFDSAPGQYGYALNVDLAGVHMSTIEDPHAKPLFFDSTNLSKGATESLATMPSPGRYSGYNTQAMADTSTRFIF